MTFTLRDAHGAVIPVEPYLGMAAHAVVVRAGGDVYVHLHPVGTTPMAAVRALAVRTPADSTRGALRARMLNGNEGATGAATMVMAASFPGRFTFPYAFPKRGTYRIWVQFRHRGAIRTVAFNAIVTAR